jgi:hypothetical protein
LYHRHASNSSKDLRSANISPEPIKDLKLPLVSSTSDTEKEDDPNPGPPETIDSFSTNLNSFGGVSTSPSRVPIRHQTTGGIEHDGNRSPLKANFTGGMFARSGTFARTPNMFGSSPTCPRCGKAVYFAEQVCNASTSNGKVIESGFIGQRDWKEVAQGLTKSLLSWIEADLESHRPV